MLCVTTNARDATTRGTRGQRFKQVQLVRTAIGWKQSQLLVRWRPPAGQLDVEVLLLHRHLEHADLLSGITAALTVGR
jgi:hypothetical protein